jgi:hypothetical protein
MRMMLSAIRAELTELNPLGRRLFVLRLRIVTILAFRALECDDFARHLRPS